MENRPRKTLAAMYERLLDAFGPQNWWPARTPTEVAIGAVLTQNTAWRNVERAIANLEARRLLDFRAIDRMDEDDLASIIRPAGTYRVKARRLRALARWVCDRGQGDIARAVSGPLPEVRSSLLAVNGIGPETADAILLYAGDAPTFVVDAYTRRILLRHLMITPDETYDEVQRHFHGALPRDPVLFNEFHALLVELAKRHCRVRAHCKGCPLEPWPHQVES